jgi:glycosyltransferase involved in cell wall biosynthesis
MKRICFVVDSIFSIGGVQRVTAVIAKELAKYYDVTIVTFDEPKIKETSLYGLQETNINYRYFSYPAITTLKKGICKFYSCIYLKLQLCGRCWSDLYARSSFPSELRNALVSELRQGQYDTIIGVHAPLTARLATLKPMLPNVKLLGWLHNSFEALFGDASLYIGAERKMHYIHQFRKLNRVVVLCQDDANRYHAYDKAFMPMVIYNPLTLSPGKLSTGSTKRFLAIGRFTPLHKGIDLLIEAFHLFAQKDYEWVLDIVGEGNKESEYRDLVNKYHLGNRIKIYPFTNHIQDFYSTAQIYVLSSRWEGMPLVLVEAMAHGLPIISSDLPVSKEIMGDFALYFKNGNIKELAQRLEDATHLDWQVKSKEALEIAKRFNVNQIIKQWKQLIES